MQRDHRRGRLAELSPDTVEARIFANLPYARAVASRAIDPRCRGADREDLIAGVRGLSRRNVPSRRWEATDPMDPIRLALTARPDYRATTCRM